MRRQPICTQFAACPGKSRLGQGLCGQLEARSVRA